jgi:hypothetical protein
VSPPSTTAIKRRAHRAETKITRRARKTNRDVKKSAANPWLERLQRLGYVVRGVLYATMGTLALEFAVGGQADPEDQRATLSLVRGSRFAAVVLGIVIVSLAAYSAWGFIRAVYDPLGRGKDPAGLAARLGFAWSGLNYAALTVFAVEFLLGMVKDTGRDSIQHLVARALSLPLGSVITTVAGAIGVIGGLGQFVDAYRAGFKKDLKRNQMTAWERFAADSLGRYGMVSRGVIFTMLGWFVLVAGVQHDPARAESIGATFRTIATGPFGRVTLAFVAVGFIALGLHSFANALWVRMPKKA